MNSPIGTTVAHLSAIDMDSEPNAFIVYRLISDSVKEIPFAINATSGTLYVSSELRHEAARKYLFLVLASNPTNGSRQNSGLVSESSRNRTYSNALHVEVFVKQDEQSALYFPEMKRNFEISASALKGTICLSKCKQLLI